MISQKRQILMLGVLTVFISAGLLSPGLLFPGDLNPTDPPGSTMHTLEDIYELLSDNNAKLNATASVEKTGQTTSYATGDDGDLMRGVAWPDPRFTDNGNGTVTDNLTGLIWLESANCFGQRSWSDALADCNNLANGSCGLTDGSVAGDWRLPNVKELLSLIDYGHYGPALPARGILPRMGMWTRRTWRCLPQTSAAAIATAALSARAISNRITRLTAKTWPPLSPISGARIAHSRCAV